MSGKNMTVAKFQPASVKVTNEPPDLTTTSPAKQLPDPPVRKNTLAGDRYCIMHL